MYRNETSETSRIVDTLRTPINLCVENVYDNVVNTGHSVVSEVEVTS